MIERITDYRIIKKVAPWQPIISSEVMYLMDEENDLWVFHPHKDGLISHVEMSERCRGKEGIERCKEALAWAFENTDKDVIYAEIDSDNKPACHNAVRCGFKFMYEENEVRHYEVRR